MALTGFDIAFDFSGTYELYVRNIALTGVNMQDVSVRVEIDHPNGVKYPGSASNDDIVYDAASGALTEPPFDVYSQADGLPYQGLYGVRIVVYVAGSYYAGMERYYTLQYEPVKPQVLADFDTFTPQLALIDNTPSYDKAGFSASIAKAWDVTASFGGTWQVANADMVGLVHSDGKYYDSQYDVQFVVDVTYTDNTYLWASIRDRLQVVDSYHAYTPPTLGELLDKLTQYKRRVDGYLGKNNILYNTTKKRYSYAWSVFHHLVDKVCGGQYSSELNSYVEEILENLADGNAVTLTHTNAPIPAFDPQNFCGTGGAGYVDDKNYVHVQSVPASQWIIEHNMGKHPSMTLLDEAGSVMVPHVVNYIDDNKMELIFLQPATGRAVLN